MKSYFVQHLLADFHHKSRGINSSNSSIPNPPLGPAVRCPYSFKYHTVVMFPSKSDLNHCEIRIKRNSNHVCFHQKCGLWWKLLTRASFLTVPWLLQTFPCISQCSPWFIKPPATHFHAELLIYAGISLLFTVKDSGYLFLLNQS